MKSNKEPRLIPLPFDIDNQVDEIMEAFFSDTLSYDLYIMKVGEHHQLSDEHGILFIQNKKTKKGNEFLYVKDASEEINGIVRSHVKTIEALREEVKASYINFVEYTWEHFPHASWTSYNDMLNNPMSYLDRQPIDDIVSRLGYKSIVSDSGYIPENRPGIYYSFTSNTVYENIGDCVYRCGRGYREDNITSVNESILINIAETVSKKLDAISDADSIFKKFLLVTCKVHGILLDPDDFANIRFYQSYDPTCPYVAGSVVVDPSNNKLYMAKADIIPSVPFNEIDAWVEVTHKPSLDDTIDEFLEEYM